MIHVITLICWGWFRTLKFSYTREFLLSLSGLDACKELPSGFDRSLLRYSMLSYPFLPQTVNAGMLHFAFSPPLLCYALLLFVIYLPPLFVENSEFEDASLDRQRSSGGLSMHSFRRNEYGSSPPTRGDTNSFSRGIHGKWESRSSGRSDKDSDSQSEWDSGIYT